MKRILFLDVDGVLQTSALACYIHMEFAAYLAALLEQAGDVDVVVSSTHREDRSHESLLEFFPECLRRFIIGATPLHPTGRADGGRQRECEAWLAANAPEADWRALDDEAHLFDETCRNLIVTHRYAGLDGAVREVLKDWLFAQD